MTLCLSYLFGPTVVGPGWCQVGTNEGAGIAPKDRPYGRLQPKLSFFFTSFTANGCNHKKKCGGGSDVFDRVHLCKREYGNSGIQENRIQHTAYRIQETEIQEARDKIVLRRVCN